VLAGAAMWVVLLSVTFETVRIDSGSMRPTLQSSDRVLTVRSWVWRALRRGHRAGEIVVFTRPNTSGPKFIKRIAAVPGDIVEYNGSCILVKRLGDQGLQRGTCSPSVQAIDEMIAVPPGRCFVVGDERQHSNDSRSFGTIADSDIDNVALWVVWPPSRFGPISGVEQPNRWPEI
jgi:signal peptidase I